MTDVSIAFEHGAGDCANFCHSIPLYTSRGHTVSVKCTPDKACMFRAAGATITDSARVVHSWPHATSPGRPTTTDHWSGNKSAYNISHHPMPDVGGHDALWQEMLDVNLSIDVSDEDKAIVDRYVDSLPRPLILFHPQGNTGADRKNLFHEQQADVLRGLLDFTDGAVITLDWDNRIFRMNSFRVRHLADDWHTLSLPQLYWLMKRCDLLIAVDSGPLHFARFARPLTIGVWLHHHPSHYVLPRSDLLNIVPASKTDVTRYRRLAYNIVECPVSTINGTFVAEQAVKLLGTRRYLASPVRDLVLQGLVDKVRTIPNNTFCDRHRTFGRFLALARKVGNPLIVETGCCRQQEDWTAGMSSYIFGVFLQSHGGSLQSVDFDANNVALARDWTTGLPVVVHQSHSHEWFKSYTGPKIDLLYLDSADVGTHLYQECCLEESKLALPHLADGAPILIDDSCWSKGQHQGKGALAIPWLLEKGYRVALAGYQVLLTRGTP